MSIRLDPRRLSALKLLAAEAGVRPGELVTAWVEERLDAARAGKPAPVARDGATAADLAALARRVDELTRRVDAIGNREAVAAEAPDAPEEPAPPAPRKRGRPPKAATAGASASTRARATASSGASTRVALHDEIAEVIRERGPLTAAEIADAIVERGRYAAPRSKRPLDAATVNSRVSNPAYRDRFTRSEGRIALADTQR